MLAFKDDVGDPMSISGGTGLVVVCPPSMYLTALEAINATIISNTTNVLAGAARVIAFPWLTLATTWYLVKTDAVIRPFIFQDREAVEFSALEENSSEGFLREKFLYGCMGRYRLTYGMWQYAVSNVFA